VEHLPLVEELSLVVTRSTGVMTARDTVDGALRLLVELVLETVAGSDACAVTTLDPVGNAGTVAASGDLALRVDEVQLEHREGPCFDAVARRARTLVHDVREEVRWSRWAAEIDALGFRSVLSAPMIAGDLALGAVEVYGRAPHAFDARSERVLTLCAAQAAVLVAGAAAAARGRHVSDDLKAALRSRDVVNTARGVLVERERVDEQGALALLLARATEEQRPLHVTAREVVDGAARRRR
jgi:signal transduction protein with GAF and PtsI domain